MDALPNEEILYKIADFWFVRSALQTVVFNKLFTMDMSAVMKDYVPATRKLCKNSSKGNQSFIC